MGVQNTQDKSELPAAGPARAESGSVMRKPVAQGLYDPRHEHDSCGVGFVAHIKGQRSHQIILDADHLGCRMDHRGARGAEKNTGDGAGMLTALPHEFLARVAREDLGVELPEPGRFAAGIVFLPTDPAERELCKTTVAEICLAEGQKLLGWREVPTDADAADLGPTARAAEPKIEQLFVAAADDLDADAFERRLYLIRKQASHRLRGDAKLTQADMFYVCSLSTKVIIYKGMFAPYQVLPYYPDLQAEDYTSHLAMVHSRFSTNTFPSWDRAQPNRFMSHNGEINTLRGNTNWMRAREGVAASELFGDRIGDLFPVIEPDVSDSGAFDNVLEFLLMSGRSLQAAIMMMVPEAWQKNDLMPEDKRAFYEFHSAMMEPWDGPASIAFTDGRCIGAVLDRNGLRPSRYYLTHDDRVIMASEVGVVPIDPANVKFKGRLEPGRMFLIDFEKGALVPDAQVKQEFARRRPYAEWLQSERLILKDLDGDGLGAELDAATLIPRMQAFGYTSETMQFMLLPLVSDLRDPVGSMGNDSALACLSDKPRMLYDYFKQLFAQVTNPPIDSIREEIIMSLECYIGPEGNLLETSPRNCHRLALKHPILSNDHLAAIKLMNQDGLSTQTIDITYARADVPGGLQAALDRINAEALQAIDAGHSFVVLSDRSIGPDRIPVSALLACASVHHHLISKAKRTRIGVIVETGEAREVHHHCLLVGYGADAINPYLAFEALWQARNDGLVDAAKFPDEDSLVAAYRKAVAKGMLKVMAKMGISTLQSYKGAQIFEALGIADEVIDSCFVGTASRLQGVGFAVLEEEAARRHALGYPSRIEEARHDLPNPGEFHWRSAGERHAWNPASIAALQAAARGNNDIAYRRFATRINDDARANCTLRGLIGLKPGSAGRPISIEEVEPASEVAAGARSACRSAAPARRPAGARPLGRPAVRPGWPSPAACARPPARRLTRQRPPRPPAPPSRRPALRHGAVPRPRPAPPPRPAPRPALPAARPRPPRRPARPPRARRPRPAPLHLAGARPRPPARPPWRRPVRRAPPRPGRLGAGRRSARPWPASPAGRSLPRPSPSLPRPAGPGPPAGPGGSAPPAPPRPARPLPLGPAPPCPALAPPLPAPGPALRPCRPAGAASRPARPSAPALAGRGGGGPPSAGPGPAARPAGSLGGPAGRPAGSLLAARRLRRLGRAAARRSAPPARPPLPLPRPSPARPRSAPPPRGRAPPAGYRPRPLARVARPWAEPGRPPAGARPPGPRRPPRPARSSPRRAPVGRSWASGGAARRPLLAAPPARSAGAAGARPARGLPPSRLRPALRALGPLRRPPGRRADRGGGGAPAGLARRNRPTRGKLGVTRPPAVPHLPLPRPRPARAAPQPPRRREPCTPSPSPSPAPPPSPASLRPPPRHRPAGRG